MTIQNRYILETASPEAVKLAEAAARKAGLTTRQDYRHTHSKPYKLDIRATTPDNDYILTLIILATTEHETQRDYIEKLETYTRGSYTSPAAFIDSLHR